MTTTTEKPGTTTPGTQLHELPPLAVTTVGIPPDEHVHELPTPVARRPRKRLSDRAFWSIIVLVLLACGFVAIATYTPPPNANIHMGLSPYAWSQYRAGERSAVAPAPVVFPAQTSIFDSVR